MPGEIGGGTLWAASGVIVGFVALQGAVLWFAIKAHVRQSILEGWREVNGFYLKSAGSQITGNEIERRLDHLEDFSSRARV